MADYGWINQRDHPRTQAALTKRCGMCRAEPGTDCRNTINGQPLAGRIIHHYRDQT